MLRSLLHALPMASLTRATLAGLRSRWSSSLLRRPLSSSSASSSPSSTSDDDTYDVVVVGGGGVGTALACLLAQSDKMRRYRVALVEPAPQKAVEEVLPPVPDLRVYALSPASRDILSSVGVWEDLAPRAPPYSEMQVWDQHGPGHICFSAAECGVPSLGYVAEHNVLQALLHARARSLEEATGGERLRVFCPSKVTSVSVPPPEQGGGWASMTMDDGSTLKSRLVVAADGGNSQIRGQCGFGMFGVDYPQRAIVCTVKCRGGGVGGGGGAGSGGWGGDGESAVAWQRFLPTGPLAVLPLFDGYASIVWSTTPDQAKALASLSDEDFNDQLNQALSSAPTGPGAGGLGGGAAIASVASASDMAARAVGTATSQFMEGIGRSLQAIGGEGGAFGGDSHFHHDPATESFRTPPALEVCSPRASFPLRLAQAHRYERERVRSGSSRVGVEERR